MKYYYFQIIVMKIISIKCIKKIIKNKKYKVLKKDNKIK